MSDTLGVVVRRGYSREYDAYYNLETGEWLEGKCRDPDCEFCAKRPEKYSV